MHRPDYDFDVITGPATAPPPPSHGPEPGRTAEPAPTTETGARGEAAAIPRQDMTVGAAAPAGDGGAAAVPP